MNSCHIIKFNRVSSELQVIAGLAGSNLLGMAIGIVGTLVQSRYVSPNDLGYFRSFTIVTGYAFVLNFGLFGALQRLYPYYMGKGDKNRAYHVVEICQAWNISVSILIGLIYLSLSIISIKSGNWKAMLGWISQIIAISSFVYGGYLNATFRSGHEFKILSRASFISSIANLIVLPLFIFFPYFTLALRSIFGSSINLTILHIWRPIKVKWRFNFKEFWSLLKEGFPIFIGGYGSTTLWAVIETTIILKFYGAYSLGLWSISFMLSEAAVKIPQAINTVYTPKIIEEVGKRDLIKSALQMIKKPLILGIPIMLLLAVISCIILKLCVPYIMPKYIAAIPVMYIFMSLLPLTLMELPFQILIATGEGLKQNYAIYGGLLIFMSLSIIFYKLHFEMIFIVISSMIGRLTSRIITYYFVYKRYRLETLNI